MFVMRIISVPVTPHEQQLHTGQVCCPDTDLMYLGLNLPQKERPQIFVVLE